MAARTTSFGRNIPLAKTKCTPPSPTRQSACVATRMLVREADRGGDPFRLTEVAEHSRARLPKQTGAVAVGASLPHSCFLKHEATAYNLGLKPPEERSLGVHQSGGICLMRSYIELPPRTKGQTGMWLL